MSPVSQPEIASLVRELRQRLELSQEQLAAQLGVSYLTVSRWENGHTNPSPMAQKLLENLVQKLGSRGSDLLKQYFSDS
jgi:putative transcriptional regulator